MRKILFLILVLNCLLFSQTEIFLQITKNLFEKANIYLIFKVEKNDFFEKFINTFSKDLEYSGYFKVNGIKLTDNIEKTKNEIKEQMIITGEKRDEIIDIKVEDGIEGKIIFENNYKLSYQPVYLAHTICDDIIEKLTGKKGIAKSKILFVCDKTGKKQIYMIDYDGFNLKQITDFDFLIGYPRYFEGNDILFVSYEDGWPKISKMNILTKELKTLIAKPGLNACVSVSKKTKEIAVVLSQSGNPEIYVANFDGEIKRRLTYYNGVDSSPSFSPDGKYITFVSDRSGKPQIYIMDKDGYGTKRISFISNYNTSPLFSPDGNYIAYIYLDTSGYGLAIYDLNTQKTRTIRGLNCEEFSWAPDSRHIVYSKTGKNQSLIIFDIFTGESRKLISGEYNCLSPNWFLFD